MCTASGSTGVVQIDFGHHLDHGVHSQRIPELVPFPPNPLLQHCLCVGVDCDATSAGQHSLAVLSLTAAELVLQRAGGALKDSATIVHAIHTAMPSADPTDDLRGRASEACATTGNAGDIVDDNVIGNLWGESEIVALHRNENETTDRKKSPSEIRASESLRAKLALVDPAVVLAKTLFPDYVCTRDKTIHASNTNNAGPASHTPEWPQTPAAAHQARPDLGSLAAFTSPAHTGRSSKNGRKKAKTNFGRNPPKKH